MLWRSDGNNIALHRANMEQLAELLQAWGVSPHALEQFYALLDDPRFVVWVLYLGFNLRQAPDNALGNWRPNAPNNALSC
jgi:hypothetical protein